MLSCPLDGGSDCFTVEAFSSKGLRALYRKALNIEATPALREPQIALHCCRSCGLLFFTGSAPGDAAFYDQLSRFDWYYRKSKWEYEFAAKRIPERASVLDVGCGCGDFADCLRAGCDYVGLEPSSARSSSRASILDESIQHHAEKYPARYSFVCLFQVLEHVHDPGRFIQASLRALRPDGELIVAVPCADSFLAMASNNALNLPPHHLTWWPDRVFDQLAGHFSLQLVSLTHEPLEDLHVGWYARILLIRALADRFRLGPRRLVDERWRFRGASHLAGALARFLIVPGLKDSQLRPRGHSVIAVYRKIN